MNKIDILEIITKAVEKAGADIAPTYQEYMPLAFAIANDCGEPGRKYFHRLCRISPKYKEEAADKIYNDALANGDKRSTLGTVVHLATQANVEIDLKGEMQKLHKLQKMQPPFFPQAHARVYNNVEDDDTGFGDGGNDDGETLTEGSEPLTPLPAFGDYDWPYPLNRIMAAGATRAQRDVLLLGGFTVVGATLNRHLRCQYGGRFQYPNLQTFIVAPSASGKGILTFVRKLADPVHNEIRRAVDREMDEYNKQKAAYSAMGKAKADVEPPKMPKNRMFIIAGNNTGTGILQNIIDSSGVGLIFETEADTISTAIGSDYGHWSDTLRKTFDHDRLAFNRRTDNEYREVGETFLSVLLSGTPGQVKPLIPTAENGLFSRQVFYYMPAVREWQSQFDVNRRDIYKEFETMGHEWKQQLDNIKKNGVYTLCLTEAQKDVFDSHFARLFRQSVMVSGSEMNSSVVRIAVNACRMLSVTAMLRAVAEPERQLFTPAGDVNRENLKDGIIPSWSLSVTDGDFNAVMGLVDTLYLHATHILSFLPHTEISHRGNASCAVFFDEMPQVFTRADVIRHAEEIGIKPSTALSWLARLMKRGAVEPAGSRGTYRKCSII